MNIFLLILFLVLFLLVIRVVRYFRNLPSRTIKWNGQSYPVSTRRYNLIQKAMQGDEEAQYEIITEYYDPDRFDSRHSQFIPELCFYYTQQLAKEEKDLGVLTELGDLYFNGIGTDMDTEQAAAMYRRALELFDNPTPGLYIPEKSAGYRKFLQETLQKYEGEK